VLAVCMMMYLRIVFSRCTHRTSKISDIGACWNIGESALASRRCRCCKNRIRRPRRRWWRRCGGRKMAAVNSDVKNGKTGRRQQLIRQLITARVQVMASTFPHTDPPRTSQKCVYGYKFLQRWREANLYCNTIARLPALIIVGGST